MRGLWISRHVFDLSADLWTEAPADLLGQKVRFLPGSPILGLRPRIGSPERISHTASAFGLALPWSIPSGLAIPTSVEGPSTVARSAKVDFILHLFISTLGRRAG